MKVTDDEIREGLEHTLSGLERGWTGYYGTVGSESGCLTMKMPRHGEDLRYALRRALGFKDAAEMFRWNDTPDRCIEQVKDRVRDAIKTLT